MQRLAAFVTVEAGLALAILGIVAALSVTPPARHEAPAAVLDPSVAHGARGAPAGATRALIGSQIAVLGLGRPPDRRSDSSEPATAAGHAGARGARGGAAGLALPPLTIDAYPTTYLRPSVPYHAASIASGAALYRARTAPRVTAPPEPAMGPPRSASSTARRSEGASRAAHSRRSLLVAQQRNPGRGDAGEQRGSQGAALGCDQLLARAVGGVRRARAMARPSRPSGAGWSRPISRSWWARRRRAA